MANVPCGQNKVIQPRQLQSCSARMFECSQAKGNAEHDQHDGDHSSKPTPQQVRTHRASVHVQLNKFMLYMHIVKLTLAHGNQTGVSSRRLPDRPPTDSPMASEAYQQQSNMDHLTLVE
jgi:hypothetical protein